MKSKTDELEEEESREDDKKNYRNDLIIQCMT